jgi:4-amino-4-deoxy-L-arabinose transferase-like glycosyltransferase
MKIFIKKYILFILIFLLALFLRVYKYDTLTTFGYDQGQDFSTVREMILNHRLYLIGIKVSFAEFFQGPIYLYILLPFFWILNMNPIAGPIAAITISMSTLCILYLILNKLGGSKTAIIGGLVFAVSPQFIKYGNTPLYQHFTPLFTLSSLYLLHLLNITNHRTPQHKTVSLLVALGFFVGLSIETHLLSIAFALSIFIYLIWKRKGGPKTLISYIFGLIIGISPTLIFELRHNFFNTRNFLNYVNTPAQSQTMYAKLNTWITGAGNFFGAENAFVGLIILLILVYIIFNKNIQRDKKTVFIYELALIQIIINFILCILLRDFGWWYPLPFWVISLILLSLYTAIRLKNKIILTLLICLITINSFSSFVQLNNNHGYYMPEGWSMKKIVNIAQIIKGDAVGWRGNFNVLSFIDGDTRAYPLRYTLESINKSPGKVTEFNQNNAVYVIYHGNSQEIFKSSLKELREFSPFRMVVKWDLGDGLYLCRLDKIFK